MPCHRKMMSQPLSINYPFKTQTHTKRPSPQQIFAVLYSPFGVLCHLPECWDVHFKISLTLQFVPISNIAANRLAISPGPALGGLWLIRRGLDSSRPRQDARRRCLMCWAGRRVYNSAPISSTLPGPRQGIKLPVKGIWKLFRKSSSG